MLTIQLTQPSPDQPTQPTPSLADLSRNASVISSGSSSSSASSLILKTPPRPRPIRNFSSPRSRSPHSPATPRASRPPPYLPKELEMPEDPSDRLYDLRPTTTSRVQSRAQSRAGSRNSSVNGRVSADDFQLGDTLGEGSYSSVMHATHRVTRNQYAIKILDKGHLLRHQKLETALAEKNTLIRLGAGHPGFVKLHWAFHDDYSLYFVLDLASNGEMQSRISRLGSLSLDCARYYTAQIIDAIEYMHFKGVIHRDLKPENLLLDDEFRIKITDFGTGKILDSGVERTKTFVGTAQYVSPELLESSETSQSSDLWAVGCILYQMIAGRFAFQGLSDYLTWQKVKALDYTFPEGFDPQARDLVQKLLVRNPSDRLGAGEPGSTNDMTALKSHPFFESIDWSTLWTRPAPPLEPGLFKKERRPPMADARDGHNWDAVGYNWEDMVGMPRAQDEIPWISDEEDDGTEVIEERTEDGLESMPVAPLTSPLPQQDRDSGNTDVENASETGDDTERPDTDRRTSSKPIDVPTAAEPQEVLHAGSATSSSEGSPIEKLGAALEAALNRGRNRLQTPIQGYDPNWSSILLSGEQVIFHSPVSTVSMKRRSSKLLSIASVTPKKKQKIRELILTTRRVVCIKVEKGGRSLTVKAELGSQRPMEKEKERDKKKAKELANYIISVEPKGEREFVILTTSKSHSYAVDSPALASTWIDHIRTLVDSARVPPT